MQESDFECSLDQPLEVYERNRIGQKERFCYDAIVSEISVQPKGAVDLGWHLMILSFWDKGGEIHSTSSSYWLQPACKSYLTLQVGEVQWLDSAKRWHCFLKLGGLA